MAALTPETPTTLQPTAGTVFTLDAGATTGDTVAGSRRMVLICQNSSTDTAYDVTITSQPDAKGRSRSITEEIPASGFRYVALEDEGWLDAGRKLNVSVENVLVKYSLFNLGNL